MGRSLKETTQERVRNEGLTQLKIRPLYRYTSIENHWIYKQVNFSKPAWAGADDERWKKKDEGINEKILLIEHNSPYFPIKLPSPNNNFYIDH